MKLIFTIIIFIFFIENVHSDIYDKINNEEKKINELRNKYRNILPEYLSANEPLKKKNGFHNTIYKFIRDLNDNANDIKKDFKDGYDVLNETIRKSINEIIDYSTNTANMFYDIFDETPEKSKEKYEKLENITNLKEKSTYIRNEFLKKIKTDESVHSLFDKYFSQEINRIIKTSTSYIYDWFKLQEKYFEYFIGSLKDTVEYGVKDLFNGPKYLIKSHYQKIQELWRKILKKYKYMEYNGFLPTFIIRRIYLTSRSFLKNLLKELGEASNLITNDVNDFVYDYYNRSYEITDNTWTGANEFIQNMDQKMENIWRIFEKKLSTIVNDSKSLLESTFNDYINDIAEHITLKIKAPFDKIHKLKSITQSYTKKLKKDMKRTQTMLQDWKKEILNGLRSSGNLTLQNYELINGKFKDSLKMASKEISKKYDEIKKERNRIYENQLKESLSSVLLTKTQSPQERLENTINLSNLLKDNIEVPINVHKIEKKQIDDASMNYWESIAKNLLNEKHANSPQYNIKIQHEPGIVKKLSVISKPDRIKIKQGPNHISFNTEEKQEN